MRGRVFSAFYVMRDVIFLFGMAGAGLADIVDIRLLIVFASSLLFVSAGIHARRAWAGQSRRGAPRRLACARPRPRRPSPRPPLRAATLADFDLLAGRLGAFTQALSGTAVAPFLGRATVRDVAERHRGSSSTATPATSAYFILDGSTTAGIPDRGRLLAACRP